MSQVVTRAVAAHDKEKRTVSPANDSSKKRATPSIEKDKTEKKEEHKDKKDEVKEKKEEPKEKKDESKDKNTKVAKDTPQDKQPEKFNQNGKSSAKPTNGLNNQPIVLVTDVALNGDANGASSGANDEEVVILDDDEFPELAYDDDSDSDESPEPSRSVTRRSQVKPTRTPETPRPASDKAEKEKEKSDDDKRQSNAKEQPKDMKLLRLKEDTPHGGRKLRSADKVTEEDSNECRRETNYSKSRVKVSPYRRSGNDTTTMANYTGNNTTMEMDLTEFSFMSHTEDESVASERSVGGFPVRARKSYKHLKPVKFEKPPNSAVTVVNTSGGKRLCGAVVGRKRKTPAEESGLVSEQSFEEEAVPKKRHLFNKLISPFTSFGSPVAARKSAQIVGINSDLPMSCPVSVDPEVINLSAAEATTQQVPVEVAVEAKPANKRCIIM